MALLAPSAAVSQTAACEVSFGGRKFGSLIPDDPNSQTALLRIFAVGGEGESHLVIDTCDAAASGARDTCPDRFKEASTPGICYKRHLCEGQL